MKIGLPKEIKPQENRIGLTPDSVKKLTSNGHEVLVENIKTLDAHIINVYLVSAIKELKAELDAAKARITELES